MPTPITGLTQNLEDVARLMEIHEELTGTERGRRYGVEVINDASVVFVVACWEAFVEDSARQAIQHYVSRARKPKDLPKVVLRSVAANLRKDKNEIRVWDLAANGWETIVKDYEDQIIARYLGSFNTPKVNNVKDLYRKLIGLDDVTDEWRWPRMSSTSAKTRLNKLVATRGAIAHRGDPVEKVTKDYVLKRVNFVIRLSIRTSNVVRKHVQTETGSFPWAPSKYGNFS